MPIFEFQCHNCSNKIEKITLKPVREATVPQEIQEKCFGQCAGAITRHRRCVSAPAYVGLTPPATSKQVTRMSEMRKAQDPEWKQRVKKGLSSDGKKLTNLRKENRREWQKTVDTAYPDLHEKQKEVVGRAKAGEFKTVYDALSAPK